MESDKNVPITMVSLLTWLKAISFIISLIINSQTKFPILSLLSMHWYPNNPIIKCLILGFKIGSHGNREDKVSRHLTISSQLNSFCKKQNQTNKIIPNSATHHSTNKTHLPSWCRLIISSHTISHKTWDITMAIIHIMDTTEGCDYF